MSSIRRILPYVKPYWRYAIFSLVLLSALVALDLSIPRLVQRIIDQGIRQQNQAVVVQTSLLMLGISLISALIAIGNNYYSVRVGESVARDLREAIFLKIQSFSFGDLDRFTTGNLIVRLTSDTSAIQRLVQVTLRIGTRAPLLMIGSLILMVRTSQQLALSLVPLLLVTSVAIVYFSTRMEPLFLSVQTRLDRLNNVLQENIAGARVIKAFVRAGFENKRFSAANEGLAGANIHMMEFMSTMGPVLSIFVNIGLVLVIWIGGQQAIRGDLSLGQIVAFTNYLLTAMGPLIMMTLLSNVWANGIASSQRIHEVLDTIPEVQDAPDAILIPEDALPGVEMQAVDFHYNGGSQGKVLEGINFMAKPGETVAILGATGAGKSTLVNLIPRFYDVTGGQVQVSEWDVRHILQDSLLSKVSMVPQETVLFSGTVRENIAYGRPEASEEEIIAAAKAAQAHDFILAMPDGYDSHIEARGANLSGGQKQRLAIARALVTRPEILILDDSTSSVDVETETKIQTALETILPGVTRFVVAQRISTVLTADKILVLDKGRIAALGNHAELLESSPIYREIYDSQLGNGLQVDLQHETRMVMADQ